MLIKNNGFNSNRIISQDEKYSNAKALVISKLHEIEKKSGDLTSEDVSNLGYSLNELGISYQQIPSILNEIDTTHESETFKKLLNKLKNMYSQ